MEARAKQRATIGRYQTQANPIINKLIDMETDIVRESMEIIPHKKLELRITVRRILARQVAARKSTSQPRPLKINGEKMQN